MLIKIRWHTYNKSECFPIRLWAKLVFKQEQYEVIKGAIYTWRLFSGFQKCRIGLLDLSYCAGGSFHPVWEGIRYCDSTSWSIKFKNWSPAGTICTVSLILWLYFGTVGGSWRCASGNQESRVTNARHDSVMTWIRPLKKIKSNVHWSRFWLAAVEPQIISQRFRYFIVRVTWGLYNDLFLSPSKQWRRKSNDILRLVLSLNLQLTNTWFVNI